MTTTKGKKNKSSSLQSPLNSLLKTSKDIGYMGNGMSIAEWRIFKNKQWLPAEQVKEMIDNLYQINEDNYRVKNILKMLKEELGLK